jgi:putative transposase
MPENHPRTFIFIHVIWTTADRSPVLKKPVRSVLFAFLRKTSEEKGIKIIALNGVEDHVHILVQLQPVQNLAQVVRSIKHDSSAWLNETSLLGEPFEWESAYAAYTVNPTGIKQVIEFIGNQETYHKSKPLESELAVFDKNYFE